VGFLVSPPRSLCFQVDDDIIVCALGRDAPSDHDWDRFVEQAGGEMMQRPRPVLVVSDGGHPSASQRDAMNRKLPPGGVLTAVVTDSLVAHGGVTIQSWFDSTIRAFPKDNESRLQALRYLGVDPSRDAAIFSAIGGMLNAVTCGLPPVTAGP
jgi:hypothetical protein